MQHAAAGSSTSRPLSKSNLPDCIVKLVHQAALELPGGMDAEVVGAPDFGDGLHQLGVEVQAHAWEEEGRERESVKERWEGGSGQQVGEHTSLSNAAEETRSNATHPAPSPHQ